MSRAGRDRRRRELAGHPMDDNARLRLGDWAGREERTGRLVDVLADRRWRDDVLYALDAEARAVLRAEIVRRVEAAGGEIRLSHVVLKLAAGDLQTELPR